MKCVEVEAQETFHNITLLAVTDNSPENKTFSLATPAASASLSITNPDAFGAFLPGKEYYVDFSEAPAAGTEEAPAPDAVGVAPDTTAQQPPATDPAAPDPAAA